MQDVILHLLQDTADKSGFHSVGHVVVTHVSCSIFCIIDNVEQGFKLMMIQYNMSSMDELCLKSWEPG